MDRVESAGLCGAAARRRIRPSCALLTALCLGSWGHVQAGPSTGARIRNVATSQFADLAGRDWRIADDADTLIELVACTPVLSAPPDQTTVYVGPDTAHVYRYTLTACANGADGYELEAAPTGQANNDGLARASPDRHRIPLGAAVTTAGSTAAVLRVAGDGVADAEVHGLAAGDRIVIDGVERRLVAVDDPQAGAATVTLDTPLPVPPPAGRWVAERVGFEVRVTSGTLTVSGAEITVDVAVTVRNSGAEVSGAVRSTFLPGPPPTPAELELLRFVPASPGQDPVVVPPATCVPEAGSRTEPVPLTDLVGANGSAIHLPALATLAEVLALKSGEPLVIRITDPDQDLDPSAVDSILVTVTAGADVETLRLSESAPASGLFVGTIQTIRGPPRPHDCVLSTSPGEPVEVTYVDPDDAADRVSATVQVDPAGRVFDSASGQPLDGARVTLLDAATGQPTTVLGDDGISPFPSTVVSGGEATDAAGTRYEFAPGEYRFPYVPPGRYRIGVGPPDGYAFPSQVPDRVLQTLASGPFVLGPAARGEPFDVDLPVFPVDVPLDAAATRPRVAKFAQRTLVAVGDFVPFTVRLDNQEATARIAVQVVDVLPRGFRYRRGSARVDGTAVSDPAIAADGRTLRFDVGDLAPGARRELRYVTEVTVGAGVGPAVNSATAGGNVALAEVLVRNDLLSGRSVLLGRIAVGTCEEPPGADAVPVAGVRVYLDDGTHADTDSEGLWHIEGVRPGRRVVQLDVDSLPERYEILGCGPPTRQAGRGFSQLVDLRPGAIEPVDFVVAERPPPAMTVELAQRVTAPVPGRRRLAFEIVHDGTVGLDELKVVYRPPPGWLPVPGSALVDGARLEPEAAPIGLVWSLGPDGRRVTVEMQRAGAISDSGESPGAAHARFRAGNGPGATTELIRLGLEDSASAEAHSRGVAIGSFEERVEVLPEASRGVGFVEPVDGERVARAQIGIRVRLAAGLRPRLTVDGRVIDNERLGLRIDEPDAAASVFGYLGVELGAVGAHVLTIEGLDEDGKTVFAQSIDVERTGEVRDLRVVDASGNVADGRSPVRVRLELLDAAGRVIPAAALFELSGSDLAPWTAEHERTRPDLPAAGRTAAVDADGWLRFAPVTRAGRYEVELSHETLRRRIVIPVAPALRDWIVVGFAEGSAGYRTLSEQLEPTTGEPAEGGFDPDGRIALFARGRIRGDWLLTVAYDSERTRAEARQGLLQHIDPGTYYTVYGDASEQRYDAPTSGPLYLRLERERFVAMFGDFDTGLGRGELVRYHRTLHGARSEFDGERVSWVMFGAETDQRHARDELRADGTSGPYRLGRAPLLINTERVTLETRDRFRHDVVLEARVLTRHLDYDVDYDRGTLYFKSPLPAHDAGFAPNFVVVEYETLGTGEDRTAGGRVALRAAGGRVEVGATAVSEGAAGSTAELFGLDLDVAIDDRTRVRAEAARTDAAAPADAYRIELERSGGAVSGRLYLHERDGAFGLERQQGPATAGSRRAGFDLAVRIEERLEADFEAFRETDLERGVERDVMSGALQFRAERFEARGGLRHATDRDPQGAERTSSLVTAGGRYGLQKDRLQLRANADVGLGGDDANAAYPTRLVVGADHRWIDALTLFAEQEWFSGSRVDGSRTRVGLKSEPWRGGRLLGAVHQGDAEHPGRLFSIVGLAQRFSIAERWAIDFAADRVSTLRDPRDPEPRVNVPLATSTTTADSTALAFGTTYRREDWSWNTRTEWRDGDRERQATLFSGLYREVSRGTGLSATVDLTSLETAVGQRQDRTAARLGFVRRLPGSRFVWLDRLDLSADDRQDALGATRSRKIVNNLAVHWRLDERTRIGLRNGVKLATDTIDGDGHDGLTWLVGGEVLRQVGTRWDVTGHAERLHSVQSDVGRWSYGVGVGRLVATHLRVGIGYNLEGFDDGDFGAAGATSRGLRLDVRMKFDQDTLRHLKLLDRAPPGAALP